MCTGTDAVIYTRHNSHFNIMSFSGWSTYLFLPCCRWTGINTDVDGQKGIYLDLLTEWSPWQTSVWRKRSSCKLYFPSETGTFSSRPTPPGVQSSVPGYRNPDNQHFMLQVDRHQHGDFLLAAALHHAGGGDAGGAGCHHRHGRGQPPGHLRFAVGGG